MRRGARVVALQVSIPTDWSSVQLIERAPSPMAAKLILGIESKRLEPVSRSRNFKLCVWPTAFEESSRCRSMSR